VGLASGIFLDFRRSRKHMLFFCSPERESATLGRGHVAEKRTRVFKSLIAIRSFFTSLRWLAQMRIRHGQESVGSGLGMVSRDIFT
jgi:hypothetical protein